MNRDNANIIASIVDRIDKIEKTIFNLEGLKNCESFEIKGYKSGEDIKFVELKDIDVSTAIFEQDVIQFYIDTLNLELNELVKKLEDF
jgi:hypothetical protein